MNVEKREQIKIIILPMLISFRVELCSSPSAIEAAPSSPISLQQMSRYVRVELHLSISPNALAPTDVKLGFTGRGFAGVLFHVEPEILNFLVFVFILRASANAIHTSSPSPCPVYVEKKMKKEKKVISPFCCFFEKTNHSH